MFGAVVQHILCQPPGLVSDRVSTGGSAAPVVPPVELVDGGGGSPSSSSGTESTSDSSSDGPGDGVKDARPRSSRAFLTPPCLKVFVSHPRQGLWQDVRENRFKGYDGRTHECLTHSFARCHFSRSYGTRRTHRQALELVIEWLSKRESYIARGNMDDDGVVHAKPELPAEGSESDELKAVLTAPVATAYYKKSARS